MQSDRSYVNARGERLRVVYGTRRAVAVALPEDIAEGLRAGVVPYGDPGLFQRLVDLELVVPAAEDELETLLDRSRRAAADHSHRSFTLMPTSYCNMGCGYCGQAHTKGALPMTHREAMAARVEGAIGAEATDAVAVRWFGGEPLMGYAVILTLSRGFVSAAQRAGVAYSATIITNGSLLTLAKLRRLHHEARIGRIVITLDGPPEIHDGSRPLKSGGGSFHRITDVVTQALAAEDLHGLTFELRTNISTGNADHVDAYLDWMAGHGFAHPRVSFTLEKVHSWSNDVSSIELDGPSYARREDAWLTRMSDAGLRFMALPAASKPVVCAAVSARSEIISSTGAIFSCSEQPLVPLAEAEQSLARITDPSLAGIRPPGPYDGWHDRVQQREVPCADCPMLPVCGGSCPKLWTEGMVPCPSYKHNMRYRLDLLARRQGLLPQ